jgi:hypothetical protein
MIRGFVHTHRAGEEKLTLAEIELRRFRIERGSTPVRDSAAAVGGSVRGFSESRTGKAPSDQRRSRVHRYWNSGLHSADSLDRLAGAARVEPATNALDERPTKEMYCDG